MAEKAGLGTASALMGLFRQVLHCTSPAGRPAAPENRIKSAFLALLSPVSFSDY